MDGGVELSVLAQPRASRSKIAGEHDGHLKVQLAAPPVDGAANEELIRFLAERFDVPRRSVTLVSGDTGRRKRVRIAGIDVARAEAVMTIGA